MIGRNDRVTGSSEKYRKSAQKRGFPITLCRRSADFFTVRDSNLLILNNNPFTAIFGAQEQSPQTQQRHPG